jgi:hypothetical protein
LGLAGFYVFLAPGVLLPATSFAMRTSGGVLWVVGAMATLAAGLVWLAARARYDAPLTADRS